MDVDGSTLRNTRDLIAFIWREADFGRSPVAIFVIMASASRTGMIWAVNKTAAQNGPDLFMFAVLLAGVALMLLSSHWARMSGHILVQKLTLKMRRKINRQLLAADVTFFQNREQGSVFAASREHIHEVSATAMRLVDLAQAVLLLIFCIGYMALQSWPSVLAALVALAVGLFAFYITEMPARRAVNANHQANIAYHDKVSDLLRGYKELRLRRSRRDDLAKQIDGVVVESRHRRIESERYYSYGQIGGTGALAALLVAIVVILPLTNSGDGITVLQLVTLVLFSFGPIEGMVSNLPDFARAAVAYRMIRDVEAELTRNPEHPPTENPESEDATHGFQSIELRGAVAKLTRQVQAEGSKAKDSFTLGPIDLTLHPGQSVFITGGNGMGKSTLLQLLTGLRHPDDGAVYLDGTRIDRNNIGRYRGVFSAVFSEFYLFRQLYGMTPEERLRVQKYIDELGLAEGVSIIGDTFASLSLSTGQMRRLALAVALAEQRPIIVLDEFAADQDPTRRRFFYDVLVPRLARAGHCVVAVTHDEHCFSKCDRLIRMADGKIVSDVDQRPAQMQMVDPKAG